MQQGNLFFEKEELNDTDKFNDFIMISLRTRDGLNFETMKQHFDKKFIDYLNNSAQRYIDSGHIVSENKRLFLSLKGIHISDAIISDLMYIE